MIKGFNYCGYCNCDGVRNLKYCKDGYIVYIRPKKKNYHIKHGNTYLKKFQPIKELCSQLKNLGLVDSEECLSENSNLI